MKTIPRFSAAFTVLIFISLLFSCRKEEEPQQPTDFRTPVLGTYTGTMHELRFVYAGSDTLVDSTYAATIAVTVDNSPNGGPRGLRLNTLYALLDPSYQLTPNLYYAPYYGSVNGAFTLTPAYDSLSMRFSDEWAGVQTELRFNGVR